LIDGIFVCVETNVVDFEGIRVPTGVFNRITIFIFSVLYTVVKDDVHALVWDIVSLYGADELLIDVEVSLAFTPVQSVSMPFSDI